MGEKKKLLSLTIRWQPTEDKPFADIVEWLNKMPIKERRKKVKEVCMMTVLPYALEASHKTDEEIERCYWEVHERLQGHLFTMRQTLGIKQRVPFDSYSRVIAGADNMDSSSTKLEVQKEEEVDFQEIDSIFGA